MVYVICPPLSISSIVVSLWLAGCLAKSTLIGWREYYGGGGVGVDRHLCGAQQTRGFDPMLFHYWPIANGAGPTLKQHRVKASCLLGELSALWYTRAVCVWLEQAVHSALCKQFHASQNFGVILVISKCRYKFAFAFVKKKNFQNLKTNHAIRNLATTIDWLIQHTNILCCQSCLSY